ncbi:MAG: hypothetical protein KDH88_15990 [Chromatiales bacterium]|nr:hypothetical protein [Chromatiales bacterium]
MTTTLVQKHLIKGTREFTLVGEEVQYTIQSPLKTESLSVVLCVLDPEPVVSGSMLAFVSQVNREPLVELFLDKPDKETFDAFVETMRKRISEEDFSRLRVRETSVTVDADRVGESIDMLRTYVDPLEIEHFLSALAELQAKPGDHECLVAVAEAFNELGFVQGQVITYAPYVNFLLSGES